MAINLCNLQIDILCRDELDFVSTEFKHLIPLNAECLIKLNENPNLQSILKNAKTCIDGQIPAWIAKYQNKGIKIEKISGSDIIYDFCNIAARYNYKVFLLGGRLESNKRSIDHLKVLYPQLIIKGFSPPKEDYPFSSNTVQKINSEILEFCPDIIFVGFGFGKQEQWIFDNKDFLITLGTKWAISCGGTFEFVGGVIKRAPKFISNLGFEGFWRLLMEPKFFRLKRILYSFKIFKYI